MFCIRQRIIGHNLLIISLNLVCISRLVGMDMGISMAATNAASAANNVTQNLNTTISQLQSSVENVEGVVKNIASNEEEGLDLSKLSTSISQLEGKAIQISKRFISRILLSQSDSCVSNASAFQSTRPSPTSPC